MSMYKTLTDKKAMKSYACTFGAGYVSGICGEMFTLAQNKKFNSDGLTNPAFRDNCTISGIQQVAKEFSKNSIKVLPNGAMFAKEHPFLFGASTGFPMWALTRLFATPLQNARKGSPDMKGFGTSVKNDVAYHTIKNGLDEVCAQKIFPVVIPKINNFWGKRCVEGLVSATVGAGTYVLAWPVKSRLTGQKLPAAWDLCKKNFGKVFVKKVSYTLARPEFVKLVY